MEQKIDAPHVDLNTIVNFLLGIELFKNLSQEALKDLASSLILVFVEGGTTIIRQGDLDTSMYILFQGRLRVYIRADGPSADKELILAEISVGQFVGEIALLTHLPRTTTVRSIRDSILLKLEESAFKLFEQKHTLEVVEIAKTALIRLAKKPRPTQIGENVVSIAIAPAGNSDHRHFCEHLVQELNKIKPTLFVNQEICNRHFGENIAQSKFEDRETIRITAWLQSLENQFGFIIYETDQEMTPWTQRCIRQADRLILLAEHSRSPALNSIESFLFTDKAKLLPYIEMVFVHPDERTKIYGTDAWLKRRICYGHYHLKLSSKADLDRFIRFLTGRAFGVVLNGGGARGLAHIGALKALDELSIPIDFIAGSSMGAIIAAGYASMSVSELIRFAEEYSLNFKKDWTLPIMALLKGKYNTDFYQHFLSDMRIEDLWVRYFCVSTNLTQAKLQVHSQGLIWLAVRASTSIPAIYPPIYDEEGNMLVDGGVMNNMPVDIMRQMMCGGKILAVNCNIRAKELTKRNFTEQWISGWKLFFQKLNPFLNKKLEYDTIINILLASMNLTISFQQKRMEKEADYLLEFNTSKFKPLEFQRSKEIIELGYQISMEKLPSILRGCTTP